MSTPAQGYVTKELACQGWQNIHDLLDRACARHPQRVAFSCAEQCLTYAQLQAHADAFARYLRHALGLQPGDRLALQLPNGLHYPIVTYGTLKAGLVLVNTNPQYTPLETAHQLRDSGARAIVVLDRLLPQMRALQGETAIEHLILCRVDELDNPGHDGAEADAPWLMQALRLGRGLPAVETVAGLERLALLQYTGGTTGVAKGAMLSHYNLLANVAQTLELFDRPGLLEPEIDARIAPLPLYHIMAFATNCLSAVAMGLHTILIRDGRNLDEIIEAMQRHPFSLLTGINTLFVGLMSHPGFSSIDFSRLKWVTAGGAPLNQEVVRRWLELTGAPIREGFGLTETSPIVSTSTSVSPHREGYIGLPLVDTELRTVDDHGADCPPNEPGELWIRGPQVMRGYWQRPEDSAQVLTDDGWLKTGDVAVLDESGFLKIVDRKKDMILVSGFNVYPNEIEDAVMRHPGVRECVAVGVPDARKGEAVKLYVSLKDVGLDAAALLAHCRLFLTGYKVPSSIEILDELPKSAVGKLLRRELRDLARRG
ncbi:AMP-binding protein [Pseudomonas sp. CAU 1711]|uniref:AMP-binding protein n=1 Tax=Pseudomonas sp. CAU 1711 TaxID=3140356 RepID=UPI00326038B5